MGSSTSLYAGFVLDRTELIKSLAQYEEFDAVPEQVSIKKRFCPDTGKELEPERVQLHSAVPRHRRIVVILCNHIVIDDVEIIEPDYVVPVQPDWWMANRYSNDESPAMKEWREHSTRMVAAQHNVHKKSKLDLSKYHPFNNDDPGASGQYCPLCDHYSFLEAFVDLELKKVAGIPEGDSWGWSIENDPWASEETWMLQIAAADSYGDREARRIKMSDIEALQPEIKRMQSALAAFGLEPEFSFRTIWHE